VKPLHIAVSLRIVAKHLHMPKLPIATAQDAIRRAVPEKGRTKEEQAMVDELERVTGMPVGHLARLTEKWPAKP
jgi:hypothetical protein